MDGPLPLPAQGASVAASSTVIGNIALSHLGIATLIGALTERSEEARALNLFYLQDLKEVLEAIDWPFARKYVELGLVEEDPNDEWQYSYRYPSDCLVVRKLLSGYRQDTFDSEIPMELSMDDSGKLILTDLDEAVAKYTRLVTDTSQFSALFTRAFSHKLAHSVAARLTKGDPYKLGDKNYNLYVSTLQLAAAAAAKENRQGPAPESEFIRGRE